MTIHKYITGIGLILLLLPMTHLSAQVSIRGTITDAEDGSSLPGANVVVKGTTTGVAADLDGAFTISAGEGDVLVFSYTGYADQEVVVAGQATIDIALETNFEQLSDVVLIGYGQTRKKDLTGAVAKVETKEFNQGVIASADRLLTGKVAGLQITSNGGEPGGQSRIRLRGGTSISASNEPLFVVDGVPLDNTPFNPGGFSSGRNPLNFINPSDIESVTVLKDASASAIYGARAANGVIIITTKKGDGAGGIRASYDGFFSFSTLQEKPNIFDAENFKAAIFKYQPQEFNDLGDDDTDWVSEILQTAVSQKHALSISGGIEDHSLYFSASYLKNEGVIKTSSNTNTNLSIRYNGSFLDDYLTLSINSKLGISDDIFAPNVMGAAQAFDPTRPVRSTADEHVIFGGFYEQPNALATGNPVATIEYTDDTGNTNRFLNNATITIKVPYVKGLTATANVSRDKSTGTRQRQLDIKLKGQTAAEKNGRPGEYRFEDFTRQTDLLELTSNYKLELPEYSSIITATAGYSWQNFSNRFDFYTQDSITDSFVRGDKNSARIVVEDFAEFENRLISFYGRLNYSLLDRYLITGTIRRDGSTRFSESNRWGIFPSLALGWRISEEPFIKPLLANGILNSLKFRFGYGVTGQQDGILDYYYLARYQLGQTTAQYQFGDEYFRTLRPEAFNPDLKWEETTSVNYGLDFGLFDGRISGSLEYYIKNTNDLLFTIAIPAGSSTIDRLLTNVGEIQNSGFEASVDFAIFTGQDYTWNVAINYSTNQNEVLKLDNSEFDPTFKGYETGGISGDIGQTIQVLKVGEARDAFLTYEHKIEGGVPVGTGTANDAYVDQNGDGIINENDLVTLSNKTPDPTHLINLTSNASAYNFDLSFTFRASLGNYVYNNVASSTGYSNRLVENGVNNINGSIVETNFQVRQLISDYYIEDASFLRLDNITLGYNFRDFIDVVNVRLYATAQNILTITEYSGLDPEVGNGIDNNLFPRATTYLFGLNVSF